MLTETSYVKNPVNPRAAIFPIGVVLDIYGYPCISSNLFDGSKVSSSVLVAVLVAIGPER